MYSASDCLCGKKTPTGCSSCSEQEQVAVNVTAASESRLTVAPRLRAEKDSLNQAQAPRLSTKLAPKAALSHERRLALPHTVQ